VAEAALQGGSGQIALQVSEGVLRDSPRNVRALEIKADALTLLGDYDGATEIYQSLLEKDPNSVRATIGMGRIKLAKDPAAAAALFQKVLQRDPGDLTALNNLGIARDLQGRHAEAQVVYRQALAVNPELGSAEVNLALSMAMTGQGAAAIKLIKGKADQPGASEKIRHDYAVVLAMAGHRPEAERVLSESLSAEEARQMLDAVTGTHTKPEPNRLAMRDPGPVEDVVPPDVVQIPEGQTAADNKLALAAAIRAGRSSRDPARARDLSSPPPTVVHPFQGADADADAPVTQPVSPIAAAVTNDHPLSMSLRPSEREALPPAPDVAPDNAIVTPKTVAMPAAPVMQPAPAAPAPVRIASSDAATRIADADAQEAPAQAPALAPARPVTEEHGKASQADASVRTPAAPAAGGSVGAYVRSGMPVSEALAALSSPGLALAAPSSRAPSSPSPSSPSLASPSLASPSLASPATSSPATSSPTPSSPAHKAGPHAAPIRNEASSAETSTAVQFAAASSEESAHSYWQALVHKFPDALRQKEPIVIRVEVNGNVFWRLRTEGFDTLSDAQAMCSRMRASGQSCFVPRT
jgi:Flp pilus assembly protein TadD